MTNAENAGIQTYHVTLNTPRGAFDVELVGTSAQSAGTRARWALIARRYGDVDEVHVVSVVELEPGALPADAELSPEGFVRAFAAEFPMPNTLDALAHCESGRLTWDRVAALFEKSFREAAGQGR